MLPIAHAYSNTGIDTDALLCISVQLLLVATDQILLG